MWLDGVELKYVEEVGAMNIFFVIGDELITPALNKSILAGVTRDSVVKLAASWGVKVAERKINNGQVGQLSAKLFHHLTDIQYGRAEDAFNWIEPLQ